MESLWRKQNGIEIYEKQEGKSLNVRKTKYDVIVVGAGMAGILCAYYLQEVGKKVLVLEAATIASGQTDKTTAKITGQHGLKYDRLIKTVGIEKARIYARANEAAIKEYERLIDSNGIECGFEIKPAYLYTKKDTTVLKEEVKAATRLGIDAYYTEDTELPFAIAGAVCFRDQAQFSPLEFIKHLCKNLEVMEHTKVLKVTGNRVVTKKGEFAAEKIIIATHYPVINVPGFYFLRQHQERSYVMALSGCERLEGMYLGIDKEGYSFRQAGEYMLLGGGTLRTGKKVSKGTYEVLEMFAKQYFPNYKVEAYWAAQDCMPHDGIPFIGKYSVFTPNLYVVTGFQKWGMTSAMIAALIMRDIISGTYNPYAKVFTPQRFHLRASINSFIVDVSESVKGILEGLFYKKAPRCSHMGCKLVWNPEEKSWDCPCHGSRFEESGKVLDNPAKKNVKF